MYSNVPRAYCYYFSDFLIIFPSELRRKTANKILINLSVSLLLLLLSFLAGVEFAGNTEVCKGISVLLHTFILTTFCWMCVEAISLYRKAVRTFKNRGEGKKFYWTCFIIGWGKLNNLTGADAVSIL